MGWKINQLGMVESKAWNNRPKFALIKPPIAPGNGEEKRSHIMQLPPRENRDDLYATLNWFSED